MDPGSTYEALLFRAIWMLWLRGGPLGSRALRPRLPAPALPGSPTWLAPAAAQCRAGSLASLLSHPLTFPGSEEAAADV